jgi:30S ribosomal protein S31
MGKGDKKTKRGKIILGSYGVRRPRKQNARPVIVKEPEVVEVAKPKARAKATKKSKEE